MTRMKNALILFLLGIAAIFGAHQAAHSAPTHAIAMYGEPALPPDFVSLPYVNPDAPKGGRVVFGERGGFDSFNPYIRKGRAPWGVGSHVYESLLGRNWDEAFSLYGLLAESLETGPNREWVEFTLRPEARFSDGSPVTIDDLIWSFEVLLNDGQPKYAEALKKIASIKPKGARTVRFTFTEADRELPLILGLRPILKKSNWQGREFADSSLDLPIGSGPYKVGEFETNRFVTFERDPNYWGRDLPLNRGQYNLDQIRYEYFTDASVIFEAFVGGALTVYRELNAQKWADRYDFPLISSGDVVKSEIRHGRPSGMRGFVFNTRRDIFKDWRVRDALIKSFNFEFINKVSEGGAAPRAQSYFHNSELGMGTGKADGEVLALLTPFKDSLTPDAFQAYALPNSGGDDRNRKNLRAASKQLAAAGWHVVDGVLQNEQGVAFTFEILLRAASQEAIAGLWVDALKRLGITVTLKIVDDVQHFARRNTYDFDMIFNLWSLTLSPGNEQELYWGSAGVTNPGSRNYMGIASQAADAMIARILTSARKEDFVAATRALDRVLTTGRYVIPLSYFDVSRIAHRRELRHANHLPVYGDWIGFLPDVWWWQD